MPVEDGRWGGLIEAVITWYTSVDSTRLSTRDIFNTADTDTDYPVLEGYGALVARYGKGLPVSLSTPVTRIAWGGRGVTVETAKGSLRAAAAVIAVPTNVLAAGAIRFEPKLPPTKAEAIARRHGPLMVMAARFVVVLRQLNGLVAGTTGMRWPTFIAANLVGAGLWVGVWTTLAYEFGQKIDVLPFFWHHLRWVAAIGIPLVIVALVLLHLRGGRVNPG